MSDVDDRLIKLEMDVLAANDKVAAENRNYSRTQLSFKPGKRQNYAPLSDNRSFKK